MGIEPTYSAWEANVLPLNYTREVCLDPASIKVPEKLLSRSVLSIIFWCKIRIEYLEIH
jgi:hypothetical protein